MPDHVSPLLPDLPPEMEERRPDYRPDRKRRRKYVKATHGEVLVQAYVPLEVLDELIAAWGFRSRTQIVQVAVAHLYAQTAGGLERIEL